MQLSELQSLPDAELNDLAARLVMGWECPANRTLYPNAGWYEEGQHVMQSADWHPTTDRNQSGECLQRIAARRWQFWISLDDNGVCSEVRGISHGAILPEVVVPGNDARAETIAALLAHFALEGEE